MNSENITQKKILVADDDAAIVDAVKFILQDENYLVSTTLDGETVKKISTDLPDLILLDIWMSGINGKDICKHLKDQKETQHIPIIMMSANKDTAQIAVEANANDFLCKPFEINDLLEVVKKHLL